jgi:signal transduction histidine kinase
VIAAGVLVLALLLLATIPVMRDFPPGFPWGGCTDDCPRNAFFAGHQPGAMSVVDPLRSGLATLLALAALGLLTQRVRSATRLMRRTLVPVLAAAMVWLAGFAGLFLGRRVAQPGLEDVASWTLLIALPLITLGMLAGMLSWRFSEGPALARLVRRLAAHPSPEELRDGMSAALEDPSLEIAYRVGGGTGYADADGRSVALDGLGSARAVTRVFRDGEPIAAIVHDPALGERSELVDAAGTAALLVLDQQRLDAQLRASVRELRSSQARILAAADVERQRIERDLHDGAQQRLVALRMKLELMNELRSTDPGRAAVLEAELGGEIDGALDEIRGLARGIYPPLLASHGLGEALDAVAVRCPVPTTVVVDGDRRYPREVESAVYFCCREALQNVAKHAGGATRATIRVVGATAGCRSRSATTAPALTCSARTPVPAS